jgi:hypothetical protein
MIPTRPGRENTVNPNANDDSRSVALYWDFENLHAGLMEVKYGDGAYAKQDNRFKVQEAVIDVQALVELGASFGPVAINRAYGNWQYFGRYRDALLQSAVELIQLFPPGPSAKNGADIKLCLDATEDISRFAHIGTVIIIGGDSDFMPVAQKIKAAGRTLIGIGNRKNTTSTGPRAVTSSATTTPWSRHPAPKKRPRRARPRMRPLLHRPTRQQRCLDVPCACSPRPRARPGCARPACGP